VALVTGASTLPWLFFAVPAGMLVDSVSRSAAMTYANLGRGAVMLSAAGLVAAGVSPVPVLVVAVFAVSSLQTVVDTAAEAFVPDLVPAARLSYANGSLAVATRISNQFAGPMLAGFLVTVATSVAALAAGTACVVAAALLRRSPGISTRADDTSGPRRRTGVRTGVTAILRRPVLVTLIGVGAVTTVGLGAFVTVFAVYGLAPGPLGLSPPEYGVALGAIGVGAAVGSF
jgi:hypothetical protein